MKGDACQHALLIQPVDPQIDILGHRQSSPDQGLNLKRSQSHYLFLPVDSVALSRLHPSCTPLYRHRTMPAYSKP